MFPWELEVYSESVAHHEEPVSVLGYTVIGSPKDGRGYVVISLDGAEAVFYHRLGSSLIDIRQSPDILQYEPFWIDFGNKSEKLFK